MLCFVCPALCRRVPSNFLLPSLGLSHNLPECLAFGFCDDGADGAEEERDGTPVLSLILPLPMQVHNVLAVNCLLVLPLGVSPRLPQFPMAAVSTIAFQCYKLCDTLNRPTIGKPDTSSSWTPAPCI